MGGSAAVTHPLRSHKPSLEYLKLLQSHWARRQEVFGDSYNVAIVRLTLIGWMEGRPLDMSDLSVQIDMSRQQTARRCLELVTAGWLLIKKSGNRVVSLPTEKLVDIATKEMIEHIPRTWDRWMQIRTLLAKQPLERLRDIVGLASPPKRAPLSAAEGVDVGAIEAGIAGLLPIFGVVRGKRPHRRP